MTVDTRFGRKLRVPATFQIKRQFLLWWLHRQAAKEVAEDTAAKATKNAAPMFIHDATF